MSFWPRNKEAFPSLTVSFAIIGLIIVATIIFSSLAAGVFRDVTNPWYYFVTYSLAFGVSLVLLHLIRGRNKKFYFTRIPVGIYILLIIPTLGLVFLREPLIELTEMVFPIPELFENQFSNLLSWHPALFITVGIMAPVLEELIFRGIILDGFLQRYDPWKAIIWSSVVFGIAHMNPWQFISAMALGIVIGWLYWKTRSLWPGIFIHVLNNAGAYIAGIVLSEEYQTAGTSQVLGPVAYSVLLFFSLFVTILFIHWIAVFLNRRPVYWGENENT